MPQASRRLAPALSLVAFIPACLRPNPAFDPGFEPSGGASSNSAESSGASSTGAESAGAASTNVESSGSGSAASSGASSTEAGSTGAPVMSKIKIEGTELIFDVPCVKNDLACGAKAACEAVTGEVCVKQDWDCRAADTGLSFYPQSGGPGTAGHFAAQTLLPDAGNICSCEPTWFGKYQIPQLHPPCTEGGWLYLE